MPRFMIAAAHKSSGKTVITTGLLAALNQAGKAIQPFKKGPDYIDPMWLSAAAARPCYNLDFNTMGEDELLALFLSRSVGADFSLVEANKGLFDGVAVDGSDSNAALAKILKIPVLLVIDCGGMTRGIAPLLQGYQGFDAGVDIAGVILNKTGGSRHEAKLRAAVETYTDIAVLGAIGKQTGLDIGERHLGLTTPVETGEVAAMIAGFGRIIAASVDLERVVEIAVAAPELPAKAERLDVKSEGARPEINIGIAMDQAFGFYYPDDLEAFAKAGARLIPIDMLKDQDLPALDGLFIGGGFPETQMAALAANTGLMAQVKSAIEAGLPTYAECGGLMYLCDALRWQGVEVEMVGLVPGTAVMCEKPQGRGYTKIENGAFHPWQPKARRTPAHEFHYARIEGLEPGLKFARTITRGQGIDGKVDGVILHNLLAGFCHLRNSRDNPWVAEFVAFVRAHKAG